MPEKKLRNEVEPAFDILVEEIEIVANGLNENGATAIHAGQYYEAKRVIDMAERLEGFRAKVRTLQQEWSTVLVPIFRPERPPRRFHILARP